jgi:ribosome-associated protein
LKESLTRETDKALLEVALDAALDKKARDLVVLDLTGICSFTDHFIICSGTSIRHVQSIADGVEEALRKAGSRPSHVEGYTEGEWVLLDYLDFVVHVFTERAREFYELERLWRAGSRREIHENAGRRA